MAVEVYSNKAKAFKNAVDLTPCRGFLFLNSVRKKPQLEELGHSLFVLRVVCT